MRHPPSAIRRTTPNRVDPQLAGCIFDERPHLHLDVGWAGTGGDGRNAHSPALN
jgi:hypothetical protein